ncbi:MAG: protein-disulfide reductase DsbD domain-containing protein [Terracidiphilus sp.]
MNKPFCFAAAALALGALAAQGQIVPAGAQSHVADGPDAVAYLFPEQVTVAAGRPSPVALHFRIAPGLHINSHTPSDNTLIPATLNIPVSSGVRLDAASYPAGTEMSFPIDPKTKLSVYTGAFVIQARIVAAPGDHLVKGRLRYQACDRSECMPPKSITVAIDVIGK